MPNATEEAVNLLEQRILAQPPVSKMLEEGLLPEDIVQRILADVSYEQLEKTNLSFQCTCNRQRLTAVMESLGAEQLDACLLYTSSFGFGINAYG